MQDTPLSKIHFLFTMLDETMLFIVDRGKLKGVVTKLDFLKKRKNLISKTS